MCSYETINDKLVFMTIIYKTTRLNWPISIVCPNFTFYAVWEKITL